MNKRMHAFACLILIGCCSPAAADLLYKPINPTFGGDSFNSAHLNGLATAQNPFKDTAKTSTTQTTTERFLSMLESRLYSSLASQVADAIFGANAQPSGTVTFDDQQITFVNTGTEVHLTVTDFSTGEVTNISIPTLH